MVLCVSAIKVDDSHGNAVLELTDGWYPASGVLDTCLTAHVKSKRIRIGDKLWIVGCRYAAEHNDAQHSAMKSLTITLHANGTRKAHPRCKLGLHLLSPRTFVLPISTLRVDGGDVWCIDAVVQRVRAM